MLSQIEKERKTLNITLVKSEIAILETLRNRRREEKARWRLNSFRMTCQSDIREPIFIEILILNFIDMIS